METNTLLLVLLLLAMLAAIGLLVVLLLRKPDTLLEAHGARLQQALRDEQRDGSEQHTGMAPRGEKER